MVIIDGLKINHFNKLTTAYGQESIAALVFFIVCIKLLLILSSFIGNMPIRLKLARYCDARIESILLDVNVKRNTGSSW
jgi:hypothetical protein